MPTLTPISTELLARASSAYQLVIDARTPQEFLDDHLPCAVNMPVVSRDVFEQVGTLHRRDQHAAYTLGVAEALRNMASHLPSLSERFPAGSRFLVYCFRGGKRSRLWADTLETVGYQVDLLAGGWRAYRRHVLHELAEVPKQYRYYVLTGSTGAGKTRLLAALRAQGAQVLDLEAIASHRGSLIGAVPGVDQPRQKWFESQVLEQLSAMDPARPVWVEAESKRIGVRQLPDGLYESMVSNADRLVEVTAALPARVQLWHEDYPEHVANPMAMVEKLWPVRPLVGGEEYARWVELAEARDTETLFARVMEHHYDPAYRRSTTSRYEPAGPAGTQLIELSDLTAASLALIAGQLVCTEHRWSRAP